MIAWSLSPPLSFLVRTLRGKKKLKSKNGPSARALGLLVHMPVWTLLSVSVR